MIVTCATCGWTGDDSDLLCSEADEAANKPISQIEFIYCPKCDGTEMEKEDAP